ncbi:glycosyltransferase family 37 protein [Gigaspora margarita]|uniref:Glycosyltransferase family 37 protein n=1 Tax=Gigaspora margarita TaxID=4874 RepID=A0A8H4B260_GIGMA|nr:glycosyltransferase family 37 protein [Gigaspora margarita]
MLYIKWLRRLIILMLISVVITFTLTFLTKNSNYVNNIRKKSISSTIRTIESNNNIENDTLIDEIENYEYKKFALIYSNYIKKHNHAIEQLLNPVNRFANLPKVVVVKPDMKTGHGNRFPGIVCGFLYSIISDRLFFIEGYEDFGNYFVKDFDHDWNIVAGRYEGSTFKYLHDIMKNDFPLITKRNLNDEEVKSYDILYVHTWDYACAPVMSNPHYKKWINEVIPDYKVFTAISLKLLRLRPNINKQVKTFIKNNFNEYNIGVYLRSRRSVYDMVTPIEHYCQAVKALLLRIKEKKVSIFIIAGTNEDRNDLLRALRKSIDSNRMNSLKINYLKNNLDMTNPINYNFKVEFNALINMKLLSFCDDMVITYGCSFGFTAAGWSYKAINSPKGPYIIMPIEDSHNDLWVVDKVLIWGAGSNEPCMYLSKSLIDGEDKETVRIFKSNPLWIHFSQCHWPI